MNDTLKQEESVKEQETQKNTETTNNDTLELSLKEDDKLVKKIDHETLSLNGDAYKIIENYREAIDLEMIEARYSDFLEKYDYIVGDIAYEKLRLRGFYYSKNKKVPIDMRISSLKDYLTEYCSFGCAYFVLERMAPKKKQASQPKRKNKPSQNTKNKHNQNKKQNNLRKFDQAKKQEEKSKTNTKDQSKKTFTKKGREPQKQTEQKSAAQVEESKVKTVKNQKGETKFKIRQKNKSE